MAIYDIYSKRKKRQEAKLPDVFLYENFPAELRRQMNIILQDVFEATARGGRTNPNVMRHTILEILDREKGTLYSAGVDSYSISYSYSALINDLKLTEDVLELNELALRGMQNAAQDSGLQSLREESESLINEWNFRMREAGFGYEFVDGGIIRIDSQHLHAEAVKPALALLSEEGFEGADDEFREAFARYRAGDYRATLQSALHAFESTMKTICNRMGWAYAPTATAKPLAQAVIGNGLIPAWGEMNLNNLVALLESVATPRNKMAGHGHGETPQDIPQYMAQFGLNMTATAIVMLVSAYREKKAAQP